MQGGGSLLFLGFGLILGLKHAFDADHIVAISALVSKHRDLKRSMISGAYWGVGHTATLFMIGVLVLGLKIAIPENIALSFELIVGIMLMALGISVIRDISVSRKRIPGHIHDSCKGDSYRNHFLHKGPEAPHHSPKPFVVGMMHGMAGSAALMVLVVSTSTSVFLGTVYILMFGSGSIAGMALASLMISMSFIAAEKRGSLYNAGITYITGISSILIGAFLMIKTSFFLGAAFSW